MSGSGDGGAHWWWGREWRTWGGGPRAGCGGKRTVMGLQGPGLLYGGTFVEQAAPVKEGMQ